MGEIIQEESSQKKGGKRRPKKHSTHIDMTPMVDLMCLLITFFMLTTAFSKPKVMEITMPDNTDTTTTKNKTTVRKDLTYHIILAGGDKVYWYQGAIDKETPNPSLHQTNFSKDGLRKFLLEKNKKTFEEIVKYKEKLIKDKLIVADSTMTKRIKEIKKEDKKAPVILIKAADDKVKYKNIIDVIDEMAICNIGSYAIVDITPQEKKLLETAVK
ncbi:MAG: biopolymer transporter ExbD [Bacteroidales bacterium]|jgi:biopolymer transport protein ExbD